MSEVSISKLSRRSVQCLAIEICELFGEQFEALKRGLTEVELQQYLERRSRIHQLQTELENKVSRPS